MFFHLRNIALGARDSMKSLLIIANLNSVEYSQDFGCKGCLNKYVCMHISVSVSVSMIGNR